MVKEKDTKRNAGKTHPTLRCPHCGLPVSLDHKRMILMGPDERGDLL